VPACLSLDDAEVVPGAEASLDRLARASAIRRRPGVDHEHDAHGGEP
jgi:hypothetical protein